MEENDTVEESTSKDGFGQASAKFVLGTLAGAAAAKLIESAVDAFIDRRRKNAE